MAPSRRRHSRALTTSRRGHSRVLRTSRRRRTLPTHASDLTYMPPEEPGFGFPPAAFNGQTFDDGMNDEHFEGEDDSNDGTQSGYFTGLLVNDVEASHIVAHHSEPINNEASAATKSSQGRTKNFSNPEDILLVSAWLNVTMDPIQGVDQTQGTYWARIHDYFHTNKEFESTRTVVSLINRWSAILHDVNTFCGCLTRIQDMNQSGSRIDHKIANACAMYKAEDKKKRRFTLDALLECPEGQAQVD